MIRSVKHGLYAVNFGGGQVDITSGKFVFSASEAYLIEDGRSHGAGQGRHADRQRPGRAAEDRHDRQRPGAGCRDRDLRQERTGRPGRRRAADDQDRRPHRGRNVGLVRQPADAAFRGENASPRKHAQHIVVCSDQTGCVSFSLYLVYESQHGDVSLINVRCVIRYFAVFGSLSCLAPTRPGRFFQPPGALFRYRTHSFATPGFYSVFPEASCACKRAVVNGPSRSRINVVFTT